MIKQPVLKNNRISHVEKAQIELHDGDPLYREIRIENALEDESGQEVKLKEGANVNVTIELESGETAPKSEK